jgi:hypothetical protein
MARSHELNSERAFHANGESQNPAVHFVGTRCGIEFGQAPQDSALHLASIFEVLPSRQSSPSALLLNVLITT